MTDFCKRARVFEWVPKLDAKTKSKWVEKHYGNVNISDNKLSTADDNSILNHGIQSSMDLKPGFGCERTWLYRLKGDDGAETDRFGFRYTTFALRFKTKDLAQEFQTSFITDQVRKNRLYMKSMCQLGALFEILTSRYLRIFKVSCSIRKFKRQQYRLHICEG